MNLYKYIKQKIKLKEIEKLPKDKYEIAIVRSTLKNLSNLFYRDYTFFLNKENLIDRKDIYNKKVDITNIEDFSIVCKTYCEIIKNILKENYDIDSELISPFSDEFRHIDLMIVTKMGKRYIVDPLSDLVEMQVGLKTNNFASKDYYDKTYKEMYKGISFLTDEELEKIDDRIRYKNGDKYLNDSLEEMKSYFGSNMGQTITLESERDKIIGNKLRYICEHLNNRNRINGIVDLVMYINSVISKVFSKEEQSRIQVLNFFVDEKDIINKELDSILDKKDKRARGVAIKIGDKCFIMGLNSLFKEFSNNEWNEIVNENKIFIRPKFNVILLDYLKKNGADRNIVHNNEFLRLFSIFEKSLIRSGKKIEEIIKNNIVIRDGKILTKANGERSLYKIEDYNLVVEDYSHNIKDTILFQDEGRKIIHKKEKILIKARKKDVEER